MAPENPTIERRAADDLTTRELHDLLRLRVDVFVVEQQCPYHEVDGRDLEPGAQHWWVEREGAVVACIRVLREPDGVTRIGRVATHPAHRGNGLAAALITAARTEAAGTTRLDAQAHLQGWYEGLGFEVCGPHFLEDGIDHVPMVAR